MSPSTHRFVSQIWQAFGGEPAALDALRIHGEAGLPSAFRVGELAEAAVGTAGLSLAALCAAAGRGQPAVAVDAWLAGRWFGPSFAPIGWTAPPLHDPIAGDYATSDGWIRLHTNAPHHRVAAQRVLGPHDERLAMARAVARWDKEKLEAAVVDAGGCAAAMRDRDAWARHPQGQAVGREPLVHWTRGAAAGRPDWRVPSARPLQGLRVLDLTRVLAGPVASRFLAGFGAEVLRIDPPWWDEPGVVPDMTLGKRCATLDLRERAGRDAFAGLLRDADVLLHGYRSDALAGLGLDAAWRARVAPGLVDVALDAYGWTGPWATRRGFDSLVQMSCGIAEAGMRWAQADRPVPLPVQALDHATGYLLAGAVLHGLAHRLRTGEGSAARLSLARTAALLTDAPLADARPGAAGTPHDADWAASPEATAWGPARRLRPPLSVAGAPMHWAWPAGPLHAAPAVWDAGLGAGREATAGHALR